jgi:hypothetical protein
VVSDITTQPKQGRQAMPMSSQSMYSLLCMVGSQISWVIWVQHMWCFNKTYFASLVVGLLVLLLFVMIDF